MASAAAPPPPAAAGVNFDALLAACLSIDNQVGV
jgi:hypothetical protein